MVLAFVANMSGGLVDQFSARARQFRERDEERLEWMKVGPV